MISFKQFLILNENRIDFLKKNTKKIVNHVLDNYKVSDYALEKAASEYGGDSERARKMLKDRLNGKQ